MSDSRCSYERVVCNTQQGLTESLVVLPNTELWKHIGNWPYWPNIRLCDLFGALLESRTVYKCNYSLIGLDYITNCCDVAPLCGLSPRGLALGCITTLDADLALFDDSTRIRLSLFSLQVALLRVGLRRPVVCAAFPAFVRPYIVLDWRLVLLASLFPWAAYPWDWVIIIRPYEDVAQLYLLTWII